MKRTKIVCTMGPASSSKTTIREMILSGMDVARVNFSHGTHAEHKKTIQLIRKTANELETQVAILQDIAGPKIRIGRVEDEKISLQTGSTIDITTKPVISTVKQLSINYTKLPLEVHTGDAILFADGTIEVVVNSVEKETIHCTVIDGGILTSNKGVNVPSTTIHTPTITEKDEADMLFGIANDVDYIAISFVRTPEDMLQAKSIITDADADTTVIAKIEKPEAVKKINKIITVSDGIMVARGDLGVEVPLEDVALIQKKIIKLCNNCGKPVITATQMLRSMVENNRPTRAEITDVSNAILDGTDAIMLSEETANGSYPIQSVKIMSRIAHVTEISDEFKEQMLRRNLAPLNSVPDAISHAACNIAKHLDAAAILTPTSTGSTARLVARYRPAQPIIAMCTINKVCRQLRLIWGVQSMTTEATDNTDQLIQSAKQIARLKGIKPGELIVITAGTPTGTAGSTNLIRVSRIEPVDQNGFTPKIM
ncbi:MAG: Pyruvate kinase [Candidatus Argoarchaeum ethanivorans]|uniref:Pyruvate kinase n=1 Tax=Candidatus Argoarchaeum ethanivorans TaxID=2608793 RepID=A0A811TER1_9EURY|nr:MAG: Pyruvate kinase [Candidatus Argoarchaeum ethanivorans]